MASKSAKNAKNKPVSATSTMQPRAFDRLIISVSIVGILLSTYALYVEMAAEGRPGYKAMCDLSDHASCSKVLTSEYAKGFGLKTLNLPSLLDENSKLNEVRDALYELPNCVLGILFYCLMIFLTTFESRHIKLLQLVLSLLATGTSVYLAYILTFVLKDICVVCISTYFVNILLAIYTFKNCKNGNGKVKKQ